MTDYQSLPPSVLAKIALLDAHCLTLKQNWSAVAVNCIGCGKSNAISCPNAVHDEYEANREVERLAFRTAAPRPMPSQRRQKYASDWNDGCGARSGSL